MHLSLTLNFDTSFKLVVSLSLVSLVVLALWRAKAPWLREKIARWREKPGREGKH